MFKRQHQKSTSVVAWGFFAFFPSNWMKPYNHILCRLNPYYFFSPKDQAGHSLTIKYSMRHKAQGKSVCFLQPLEKGLMKFTKPFHYTWKKENLTGSFPSHQLAYWPSTAAMTCTDQQWLPIPCHYWLTLTEWSKEIQRLWGDRNLSGSSLMPPGWACGTHTDTATCKIHLLPQQSILHLIIYSPLFCNWNDWYLHIFK